jgi:prolyl oligopeptidase
MKTITLICFLTTGLLMACGTVGIGPKPPLAISDTVVDYYFGRKINDPYRYMENLQDSSVVEWIREQSDYSRRILNNISGRQELINRMIEIDGRKSEQISRLRITDNDRYFYLKTMPDDQAGKLYFRDGFKGPEFLLFDPTEFYNDTSRTYFLTNISPSIDGTKVFFVLYPSDRAVSNIFITMDVENRKITEQYDRNWMSIASWLPDSKSYLINLPSETPLSGGTPYFYNSRICLHFLGTDSGKDRVIFSRKQYPELGIKPEDIPNATYDNNSQYIFCSLVSSDRRNHVFYLPLAGISEEKPDWKLLFKREDEVYNFIATDKEIFIRSPKKASNFRILKISLTEPDITEAKIIIPEDPRASLTSFRLTRDGIYYSILRNGIQNELYCLLNENEEPVKVELPTAACSLSISSKGPEFRDIWLEVEGWEGEHLRYLYIPYQDEFKPENLMTTNKYPEYKDLMVENLMVPSHDGVRIPLTLIHKKNIAENGNNSVLLFGYGSYGRITSQVFDPNLLLWVYKGGILAIAHVRGGGEFGEHWHKSGMKTSKPNTWKDLIACTEYLISEKITQSRKIAITSSSAGGILIGRAMTESTDLFAAAIPQVGFLNPLRLNMMQNSPYQEYEFGNIKDSVECMALIEMDPYHHLSEGVKYPATLVTAGMLDQAIPIWMPSKFAARLQSVNISGKPVLFYANPETGHMADTKSLQIENLADVLSFALWQTGHPDFQFTQQ